MVVRAPVMVYLRESPSELPLTYSQLTLLPPPLPRLQLQHPTEVSA